MLSLFRVRGFDSPGATLFQQWINQEKCASCGVKIDTKSFEDAVIWVGSSGTRWTDVLSNIDGLIVSRRVVEALETNGLSGFSAHPVKIEKIESKKLSSLLPPQYFLLDIHGRFEIEQNQLDDEGGSVCPACNYRTPSENNSYRWKVKRLVPKLDTWDGSDLALTSNLRNATKYCSKRFVKLANQHKWTNFIFGEGLPDVGLWEKPQEKGLTYSDPAWFDKLSERVKAKHPDLFEGSDRGHG